MVSNPCGKMFKRLYLILKQIRVCEYNLLEVFFLSKDESLSLYSHLVPLNNFALIFVCFSHPLGHVSPHHSSQVGRQVVKAGQVLD